MSGVDDASAASEEGLVRYRPAILEQLSRGSIALQHAIASRRRNVPAQSDLTRGKDLHNEIGALLKGWACRYRLLSDGRRQILDVYLPGDLIGLDGFLLMAPQDFTMALTDLALGGVDYDTLLGLMADPDVSLYVFAQLAAEKRRLDDHLTMVGQLLAEEKIAALLLDFYNRLHDRQIIKANSYDFPLTQQQLGDLLGMTVVHVNRVLRRLRDHGVVNVKHRVVMLQDMDKLESLAAGRGSLSLASASAAE
jgi:CRP/FNR family transcriptional regulator